jgi:hypothetical protein
MSCLRTSLFLVLAVVVAMPALGQAAAAPYVVTTNLLYEEYGDSRFYERGCLVAVERMDGGKLVAVPGVEVKLMVPSHSDLRIRDDDTDYMSSHVVTTDSEGEALFAFLIGSGVQLFDVLVKDGRNGFQLYEENVQLATSGYRGSTISDLLASQVMLGTTFQTEYDESGQSHGFQDTRFFGQLTVNTMLPFGFKDRGVRNSRWHTHLNFLFSSFPVVREEGEEGEEEPDRIPDDFSEFADSLTAEAGVTLFLKKLSRYSATSSNEELPYDALRIGIPVKFGIITRDQLEPEMVDSGTDGIPDTEVFDNADRAIWYGSIGFILTHHQTKASSLREEHVNRLPMRWFEAAVVWYEEYAGLKEERRYVFDTGLRLAPLGNDAVPFYVGMHANLGHGPDDIRIFAGLTFDLDKLAAVMGL